MSSSDTDAGTNEGNIGPTDPDVSFISGLIGEDGTINLSLLADRSVGTVFYGVVLFVIGWIQFIGSGIRSVLEGAAGFVTDYIGAIYTGAGNSDGVVGAISQATTGINAWLDPLGVLAYPITILIGLALGIAVIRVTIAGFEIVLGTNL